MKKRLFILFTVPKPHLAAIVIFLTAFSAASSLYAKPGDLDRSFGTGGVLTATLPMTLSEVGGTAMQSDGKTIVVGSAMSDFAVYRLNADGSLDPTFGGFGLVTVSIGSRSDIATAAFVQSDGKIVVSGFTHIEGNFTDFAIVRFNANGSLDTSFNGDGINVTDVGGYDFATTVTVQSDGKIILAGRASTNFMNFTLVRYNANGSLDNSFSGDGIATTQFPGGVSGVEALKIQSDGKIVAAGTAGGGDFGLTTFGAARYNPDGTLDSAFGTGGTVTVDVRTGPAQQNTAYAVEIQADGKIVAAGVTNSGFSTRSDVALLRLNANGSIDESFGIGGKVVTPVSVNDDYAETIAIQPDGKLLIGGGCSCGSDTGMALIRYNADGSLDTRFGKFGIALPRFAGGASGISLLRIGSDGRIFSAAFSRFEAKFTRFLVNGYRESDFDADGISDLSVWRPSDNIWYLLRGTAGYTSREFGVPGDLMSPSDFDGDGKTDVAVFRPSNGTWYIFNSGTQSFSAAGWGASGDLPAPADHDGDGKADLVVFRPTTGVWHTKFSLNNALSEVAFGVDGDKPLIGDFDGDGRADIGVFRPSDNNWYVLRTTVGFSIHTWGQTGDIPSPADYDGDGKTDLAIFRPSTGQWFRNMSMAGIDVRSWGQNLDIPVAADYDGDGKADIAVFRPTDGTWYKVGSTTGIIQKAFGQSGDLPTQGAFIY